MVTGLGAAVALDASLVIQSARGERTVAARDFFRGPHETALEVDELLTFVWRDIGYDIVRYDSFDKLEKDGLAVGPEALGREWAPRRFKWVA